MSNCCNCNCNCNRRRRRNRPLVLPTNTSVITSNNIGKLLTSNGGLARPTPAPSTNCNIPDIGKRFTPMNPPYDGSKTITANSAKDCCCKCSNGDAGSCTAWSWYNGGCVITTNKDAKLISTSSSADVAGMRQNAPRQTPNTDTL